MVCALCFCDEQLTGVLRLKNQARSGTQKVKPILVLAASHEFKLTPSRWKWKAFNWAKRKRRDKEKYYFSLIYSVHTMRSLILCLHSLSPPTERWFAGMKWIYFIFYTSNHGMFRLCLYAEAFTFLFDIHIIQYIFSWIVAAFNWVPKIE